MNKITIDRATVQQALEALDGVAQWVEQRPKTHPWDAWKQVEPAMIALREALEQPEPPGLLNQFLALAEANGIKTIHDLPGLIPALQATEQSEQESKHVVKSNGRYSPLLTHMMNKRDTTPAAAQQRKPLTEKRIHKLWRGLAEGEGIEKFARAIEAAHGIKVGK